MSEIKTNWFGRERHPSDELVHWSDFSHFRRGWGSPVGKFKTFDDYVDALRAAYDLIHSDKVPAEVKAAYELLLEAKEHQISMEEGEKAAGEDL
jgi:hypothetical protein